MADIEVNIPTQHPWRWLPYVAVAIGILISIGLWDCLFFKSLFPFAVLNDSMPWIVLALGICTAILIGIAIRLGQLSREHFQSLSQMNQEFKKEMIEHMQSEESKQKLEKALLQGQKLQAIGTLAGGIAHDFNNLLYAIIGYVEMAREDVEKETLVFKNLGKVLEASHRGQELIARILEFSRRQHNEFKPIQLQNTIENVLSLLRPTIPAGVTVIFHTMKEDCMILGDETQLHQVIVNIINNAVDAMDGEGIVTLKVDLVHTNDEYLKQFPHIANNDYCRIDIADSGRGIDQATISRIFEPFFTTKEVGRGTGLGLSTVHAIIEDHKGKIIVNSQLGRGTTFTFLLPEYHKETDHGENPISGRR